MEKKTAAELFQHYIGIKQDVQDIVDRVLERVLNDPSMAIIQKGG